MPVRWLITVLLILLGTGRAFAAPRLSQTGVNMAPRLDASAPRPKLFSKGSFSFQIYQSGTLGEWSQGSAVTTHVGGGYYLVDDFSINFEALGSWVHTVRTHDDGGMAGFDLLLRGNLLRTPDFTIYADGGAGAQEASVRFPNDSQFNFRTMVGLGMTVRLTGQVRLMAGVRYIHISDAGLTPRNNGLNAAQPYLGVMIPF